MRGFLARFSENSLRDFPWRQQNVSIFEYLLTEIFLQQTKAETVSKFYKVFFQCFQSWDELSQISVEDLANTLRPLGLHNQRAQRISNLAQAILYIGNTPTSFENLIKLPGIGLYVASAVASRFGNECHPMLDVNMVRVLTRYFDLTVKVEIRRDLQLRTLAHKIVEGEYCVQFNWAILDIGAMYCTQRNPNHVNCLLRQQCIFFNIPVSHDSDVRYL
jgi:A/G-specific adenine glycosylase